ncbi:MAG: hypothetical protein U1F77_12550 [Kiritimatiellia bacterium]
MERIRAALREWIDYTYALRLLLANSHDAAARKGGPGSCGRRSSGSTPAARSSQLFADLAGRAPALGGDLDLLREVFGRPARPVAHRDSLAGHLPGWAVSTRP